MRKIIYLAEFEQQLQAAQLEFPRIEDYLRGLKHVLARNPQFGTQVQFDPPLWFVGAPDIFAATLGVSYTFDDDCVYLLSLWISEE